MKYKNLSIMFLIIFAGLFVVNLTKIETQTPYYDKQMAAYNKTLKAYDVLKEKREELEIEIEEHLDPLKTGLIGSMMPIGEYSITTTWGNLVAKQTSLNPNFAALFVSYFKELNIKENESVAVNFSSSFPALNVMIIIALDVLEINSFIMSSLGASTYGANIIDFNYLEIEEALYEAEIIKRKTEVMSLGGDKDNLSNIAFNDDLFRNELYERYDYLKQIKEPDLEKNVKYRYDLFNKELKKIKAFINVGGNIGGRGLGEKDYENGIIRPKPTRINKTSGLIDYFLNDGVSVINLLNIKDLAEKNKLETFNGLPYEKSVGDCYFEYQYNKLFIIITILLVIPITALDIQEKEFDKYKKGSVLENEE